MKANKSKGNVVIISDDNNVGKRSSMQNHFAIMPELQEFRIPANAKNK